MRKILVTVRRDDEWSAVLQAIREDHYHLLAGRDDVGVREELDLLLRSPGGNLLTFEARVLRVTPGKGAALEVYAPDERKPRGWRPNSLLQVTRPFDPEPVDGGPTVKELEAAPEFDSGLHDDLQVDTEDRTVPDLPPPPPPAEEAAPPAEEAAPPAEEAAPIAEAPTPGTLHARLQGLSVTEKQKLALSAERTERAILVRDNLKQVHAYVLRNPRVTDDEALEYAKYAGLSAQALTHIAENARWMRSLPLRFALVKNPQVPSDVARRVLETLGPNEVRYLAKGESVRPDVRQMARKWLERKGML